MLVPGMASLQCGPADASSAWSFNKCLSTLCTDVDPGTMRMKVLTHRSIVTKHLIAALSKEIGKKKKISKEEVPPPPKFSFGNLLYEDREYFVHFHLPLDDAASLCA